MINIHIYLINIQRRVIILNIILVIGKKLWRVCVKRNKNYGKNK